MNFIKKLLDSEYKELSRFEKIANECEAFTKSRAEYKKNNL